MLEISLREIKIQAEISSLNKQLKRRKKKEELDSFLVFFFTYPL